MNRKAFIQQSSLATAGILLSDISFAKNTDNLPLVRIAEAQRKFKSKSVERVIAEVKKHSGNKEIGWMFENCFPNTLDTTVDFDIVNGKADTYVITGDIDAMWLRDSTAQVWPYLPLCKEDKELQQLMKGVINRQVKCILLDPYANAFYKDTSKISEWKSDLTKMKPGIHERKWEVDSLCYPLRLSHGYWKVTGDTSAFDDEWKEAIQLVIQTFKEQQRLTGKGPYSFQRNTAWATDGVPLAGYGYPVKPNGMICSMFRPSDDATIFPYLIPSNFFAFTQLLNLGELLKALQQENLYNNCVKLANEVKEAFDKNAFIQHKTFGEVFAYEGNGFGSFNLMDDANVPSLLSLPYLDSSSFKNARYSSAYKRTRQLVLSNNNPFFFKGKAGEGVGGPHVGVDYIWPLSITMRGLTSIDDKEIKLCIEMLRESNAGTGFIHESFYKDDASKFTRKWFAWANTLFGEFIWKVYRERPLLLS